VLTITILNDQTGTVEIGNYTNRVVVNRDVIAEGRIDGHKRELGWVSLVADVLCKEDVEI